MMISADPTSVTQAKETNAIKVLTTSATNWYALQFNTLTAPFNNINAREAVEYAINPKAISTAVTGGLYTPNQSMWGSGMEFHWGTTTANYHVYDPTKVAALVAALPGGKLSFSIFGVSNTAIYEEQMQAMQQELGDVGITMNILNYSHAVADTDDEAGNFQSILANYGGYSDNGITSSTFLVYPSTFGLGDNDATQNKLVAEANGTSVPSKRLSYFKQLSEYLNQQSYWDPLFTFSTYDLVSSNVDGYIKSPLLYLDSAYLGKQ